jgi:hypothetical protein
MKHSLHFHSGVCTLSKEMEAYAEKRNKKEEIREVHVKKAKGGFVVTTDYDSKPSVYKDLDGVFQCLQDKFGVKSKEESKEGE